MWQISASLFLGWSLGSNDAANVFGTAVASRMVKFWVAALLASTFVILGAVLRGQAGIETYSQVSATTLNTAFVVSLAAALTVTVMTVFRLPVSTSQAVVGGLVMLGVVQGDLDLAVLGKVGACWVGTPIGSAIIAMVLYFVLGKTINHLHLSLFAYDKFLRHALVLVGSYGAFALGANNVANVVGPVVGAGAITPLVGTIVGSVAIALGICTYSRQVMMTVGRDLVKLDAFTALVVVLSEAITVHIYAEVGVPVSTSQAVVGAVLGIGLLKGVKTVRWGTMVKISFGWVGTPAVSFAVAYLLWKLLMLVSPS